MYSTVQYASNTTLFLRISWAMRTPLPFWRTWSRTPSMTLLWLPFTPMSLRAKIFLASNAHVRNHEIHIINFRFFIYCTSDTICEFDKLWLFLSVPSGQIYYTWWVCCFQDMTFDMNYVLECKTEISVFFLTAPSGPPQNLQVFNATTTSLTAKWDHAPGRVQNYKITYVPVSGGRSQSVRNISPFETYKVDIIWLTEWLVMWIISTSGTKRNC